jgi:hypothetical protein
MTERYEAPLVDAIAIIRQLRHDYEGGQDTALRAIEVVRVAMTQLRTAIKNPVW